LDEKKQKKKEKKSELFIDKISSHLHCGKRGHGALFRKHADCPRRRKPGKGCLKLLRNIFRVHTILPAFDHEGIRRILGAAAAVQMGIRGLPSPWRGALIPRAPETLGLLLQTRAGAATATAAAAALLSLVRWR
jgi:hypothetical protein